MRLTLTESPRASSYRAPRAAFDESRRFAHVSFFPGAALFRTWKSDHFYSTTPLSRSCSTSRSRPNGRFLLADARIASPRRLLIAPAS